VAAGPSRDRRGRAPGTVAVGGAQVQSAGDEPVEAEPSPALISWFEGIKADLARRMTVQSYVKDWADGLHPKSISTVLFMYFACIAPVIAFGGLTGTVTSGVLGVPHFLASAAFCGCTYHLLAGQPMTMIGPTGLTFTYVSALYALCEANSWPFMQLYCWTGLWTSCFLLLLACGGACNLIKYCTRFTDDVFNSLIAITFFTESLKALAAPFLTAGPDKTLPFIGASLAVCTYWLSRQLTAIRSTRYLRRTIREFISDFGPTIAIGSVTLIAQLWPTVRNAGLDRLKVPDVFSLGRDWLIPFWDVPTWVPAAAAVPAVLLTMLFFLDQNISSRVVNSKANGLKKGSAYHWDLVVLGSLVGVCSVLGLPWMVAATVQSLNHIRAQANIEPSLGEGTGPREIITSVRETRVTGFTVHAMIGASVLLLPVLKGVPNVVISGLFLYLGRKMMTGNEFLYRLRLIVTDPQLYPPESYLKKVTPTTANLFTLLQLACLAGLWILRSNKQTALFFPGMIAVLMAVRSFLAPRLFSETALEALDESTTDAIEEGDGIMEDAAGYSPLHYGANKKVGEQQPWGTY